MSASRNVSAPRIMLNGIDEGIRVQVSTTVSGAESPKLVLESVQNIFPDFTADGLVEPKFGTSNNYQWKNQQISLNNFLQMIHKQAILDTALDVMGMKLKNHKTSFQLLRQASIAKKIAFNLDAGNPLGGVINVELSGDNLADWLEAATWHKGRDTVPKRINDERKMDIDGEASTWI